VAATASIRVIKSFTYRGATRQFSNRYHIGTAYPPDSAHWTTLSDAIVTAEKAIYMPLASLGATIVGTVGYAPGSEVPVFTKTYSTTGTGSFSVYTPLAGDCAALIRYSTPDRSTKNHPVYCFNYYHAVGYQGTGANPDTLNFAQAAAMSTYATAWITGFSDGTTTYHRSRPTGNLVTGQIVESLITHRDLPH
jgi:hypothetical protein